MGQGLIKKLPSLNNYVDQLLSSPLNRRPRLAMWLWLRKSCREML